MKSFKIKSFWNEKCWKLSVQNKNCSKMFEMKSVQNKKVFKIKSVQNEKYSKWKVFKIKVFKINSVQKERCSTVFERKSVQN